MNQLNLFLIKPIDRVYGRPAVNRNRNIIRVIFLVSILSVFLGISSYLYYDALLEADFLAANPSYENPDLAGLPADKKTTLAAMPLSHRIEPFPLINRGESFPFSQPSRSANLQNNSILRC